MRKSKLIDLPTYADEQTCYVCGKKGNIRNMINVGDGTFRHRHHRQSTILKATPPTHADNVSKKRWIITIPEIRIEVKEG